MNYIKLYENLVTKFKLQTLDGEVYTERHHIVPKHCGGTDCADNLVTVTYRQHRLLHRIRWKAFGHKGDKLAYILMYGVGGDLSTTKRAEIGRLGGIANVESGWIYEMNKLYAASNGSNNVTSGHLDRIRHLANNKTQREKASKTSKTRWESGDLLLDLQKAWAVNKGSTTSEYTRQKQSQAHIERMKDEHQLGLVLGAQKASALAKSKKAEDRSLKVLSSSEDNSEWLNVKSPRSKYNFLAPNGLVFESPIFAAKYFGNIDAISIENWCKRNKYGWSVILKQAR